MGNGNGSGNVIHTHPSTYPPTVSLVHSARVAAIGSADRGQRGVRDARRRRVVFVAVAVAVAVALALALAALASASSVGVGVGASWRLRLVRHGGHRFVRSLGSAASANPGNGGAAHLPRIVTNSDIGVL